MRTAQNLLLGDFHLDLASGSLNNKSSSTRLSPRSVAVLVCLAESAGEVVSREQLHKEVWQERFVTDSQVSKAINEIRAALGDNTEPKTFIETLPRRGYRLICPTKFSDPKPAGQVADDLVVNKKSPASKIGALAMLAAIVVAVILAALWFVPEQPRSDEVAAEVSGKHDTSVVAPALTSIGVLTFENIGPSDEYEWLAYSMAVELIEALSRTKEFRLPTRSSMERISSTNADLATLGRKLKVGSVVEGSIQVDGDNLRVFASLSKVADGSRLWSTRYDRKLAEIFDVQRELSINIAEAVRRELGIEGGIRPGIHFERYVPENLRAYELHQKTHLVIRQIEDWFDPEKREQVRTLLDQALMLEPSYAGALAGKAIEMYQYNPEGAQQIVDRLTELDYPGRHFVQAEVFALQGDWQQAEIAYQQAAAVAPWHTDMQLGYAEFLLAQFRYDEALAHANIAVDLDPLTPLTRFRYGAVHYHSGQYEKSIAEFERSVELGDTSFTNEWLMTRALFRSGRESAAAAMWKDAIAPLPDRQQFVSDEHYQGLLDAGKYKDSLVYAVVNWPVDCAKPVPALEGRPEHTLEAYVTSLAVLGMKDQLYACIEVVGPRSSLRLHDFDFKPYWHEERFQSILEARNLDGPKSL